MRLILASEMGATPPQSAIIQPLVIDLITSVQSCIWAVPYKDHPDVYHFFVEGVEQKLSNGEVLIGYRWT